MKRQIPVFFLIGLLSLTFPNSLAQGTITVFDTFLSDGSFDRHGGGAIGSPGLSTIGFRFKPSESGSLHSVDVALFLSIPSRNSALLSLTRVNPATGFPGAVLESFSADGRMQPNPATDSSLAPLTFVSAARTHLSTSEQYWLVASAPSDASVVWNASLSSQRGAAFSHQGGQDIIGEDQTPGTFRINVTAVPEPAIHLFVAGGLIALALFRTKASC